MQCAYFGCQRQAERPWACCSIEHGEAVKWIKFSINAGEDMTHYNVQESRFDTGHLMTHEEFEHYARMVGIDLRNRPHLDLISHRRVAKETVA